MIIAIVFNKLYRNTLINSTYMLLTLNVKNVDNLKKNLFLCTIGKIGKKYLFYIRFFCQNVTSANQIIL